MASYQRGFQHSGAPYESPAKIFAKLKSKVQREIADGGSDYESRAAEVHGTPRTPQRKTVDDAVQHEILFGHGEVTALTLSPISSPRETIRCRPEDDERLGTEHVLKAVYMPRQRPFMESTAMSHTNGFNSSEEFADCLVHREAAPVSELSMMTRLGKRKLDDQMQSKARNMFSDVNMDYGHCREKERRTDRAFSAEDHYTARDVGPVALTRSNINGCVVDIGPRLPVTPAKIFAFLKEKEKQREKLNVQKVTSSTRPEAEWDDQIEVREEPDCTESTVNGQQSPGLDEDVQHDPVSKLSEQSAALLDKLVLDSPRVSIPKTQQAVLKPKNWPQGSTFPSENEIHLKKWFIRRSHTGLFVDGIRRDTNIAWNSNVITERITKTVLKTVTGKKYVLVGKINFGAPSQFPKWFVKCFANGFPSNWKEIYENYLSQSNGLNTGSKTQSEKRSQKRVTPMVQLLQKSVKTCQPDSSFSSATSGTQVSRSGRVIKPPLEFWMGGRVSVDADMNVTVHAGYDSVLKANATPSLPTKTSLASKPAKTPALEKAPVNDDCEQQESTHQSPLQRKVKAPPRKPRKNTKNNVTEKPPSPAPVQDSPARRLRPRTKRPAPEKQQEVVPQEPKKTKKTTVQKVSKAKPVKGSKQKSPTVDSSCSSQPPSHKEKEKTRGKRTDKKSQQNLPRSSHSSSSSSSSQERVKNRSKNSRKPQTPSPKPAEVTTETTAQPKKTRKRAARNKQASVLDEDAWTEEELRKLQDAVSCHHQHFPGYWTKVAKMVGTRSADECHKQHSCQGASRTPPKREKKAKQKAPLKEKAAEKVDQPLISARVGTLRRKQQVRDFLDAMPKEDMDDVFTSAYMRCKRFEVPSMCPSDEQDFSMSEQEPLTPKPTGLPEAKTPQCLHITPGMMGSSSRNCDDKYVFQLQKRMKNQYQFNVQKHAPKSFTPTASAKKTMRRCGNIEDNTLVVWEMFPNKDQADSSEEEDFYFSEND